MKMKFHNKRALPLHRLPFIDKRANHDPINHASPLDWWCVPDVGHYGNGNDVGRNLAIIYMKYLLENKNEKHHELPWIVSDMFKECNLNGSAKGQMIGFLSTLADFLAKSSFVFTDYLNSQDSKELLKKVNEALSENIS